MGVSDDLAKQEQQQARRVVLGFVDNAHATTAESVDDAVGRDGLADHGVGVMVGGVGSSQ